MKTYPSHDNPPKLLYVIGWSVVIAIIALILGGCNPARKVQRVFDKYPVESAREAAKRWPLVDSIGATKRDTIYSADNKDFTKAIDSISEVMAELEVFYLGQIDSAFEVTSQAGRVRLDSALGVAAKLKQRISQLQKDYKPCDPIIIEDKTPVYLESGPRIQSLLDRVKSLESDNSKLMGQLSQEEKNNKKYKSWFWWLVGILAVITGFWGFIKIKTIHIKK